MSKVFTTQQQGKKFMVICSWSNTRSGFKHTAEVQDERGYTLNTAKICYYNRTWERYEYQSVIHKVLEGCRLSADKLENAKKVKALQRQIDKKALGAWY